MKTIVTLTALLIIFAPARLPAREAEPGSVLDPFGDPALAFERTVTLVTLRHAPPDRIRESLTALHRSWGIFPTLQYLELPVPESAGELLFLRGRKDEVAQASRIAEALDRAFPPPADPVPLAPLPLSHLSGESMREKLLALGRASGAGLDPEQLLVFPPGPGGSLFFRGPAAAARELRDLKTELDHPRHGTLADLLGRFFAAFRQDLSAHFLTVSTYVASALLLICLHYLLGAVPGLGRLYRRWFTLVWTRVFRDIRGRDFAYDLLRDLSQNAVLAAGDAAGRPLGSAGPEDPSPETKKSRAMAIARDLLVFRGFDPEDPEIKRVVSSLVAAALSRGE